MVLINININMYIGPTQIKLKRNLNKVKRYENPVDLGLVKLECRFEVQNASHWLSGYEL